MKKTLLLFVFTLLAAACFAVPDFYYTVPGEEQQLIVRDNIVYSNRVAGNDILFAFFSNGILIGPTGEPVGTYRFNETDDQYILQLRVMDAALQVHFVDKATSTLTKILHSEADGFRLTICYDSETLIKTAEECEYDMDALTVYGGGIPQEDYPPEFLQIRSFYVQYPDGRMTQTTEYYENGLITEKVDFYDTSRYELTLYTSTGDIESITKYEDGIAVSTIDADGNEWINPDFSEME